MAFHDDPDPLASPRTLGQKTCIVLALVLLAVGLAVLLVSCCYFGRPLPKVPVLPAAPEDIRMPTVVRAVLARSTPRVSVNCRGRGTWFGAAAETYHTLDVAASGPWEIACAGGSLTINGAQTDCTQAELRPARLLFELDGQGYRGRLSIRAAEGDRIRVTNLVHPTDYLRSVVGVEMYPSWPLEALMAQAVAARTFMIYTVGTQGYLSAAHMAYRGIASEYRSSDLAVQLTEGLVLTYEGRILPSYFHSTCGGHTVAGDKVFALEPIGPLQGVPCEWCSHSSSYSWRAELPASRIAEALASYGVTKVVSILPQEAGQDGNARFVLINGTVRLDANAFRLRVGPGEIKSTRFEVRREGDGFVFEGRGFGHGVGMCQWGACGLARAGASWDHILRSYYPGAELERIY